MVKNYLKTAWRHLIKNKGYSIINIGGLAIGMAVAILIGLWIYDELSFNKSFKNYHRLGQLFQNRTFDGKTGTYPIVPMPMGNELRTRYPDFENVAMATTGEHIIAYENIKLVRQSIYAEPAFTNMFSLQMIRGPQDGLQGPNNIMLSGKLAKSLFGDTDPVGKMVRIDNQQNLVVTGIFQDFPINAEFADIQMLVPWAAYLASDENARAAMNQWSNNNWKCYVQLKANSSLARVQEKVKPLFNEKISKDEKASHPELLIHPMNKWHLESNFTNGINEGGIIDIVRLFGFIGVFVLLLACINFMNLSTARSEKRAREVGIRKAVGSVRLQIISQFLSESMLIVFLSCVVSILLVTSSLHWFNNLAVKQISMPWANGGFWVLIALFIIIIGVIAGSYPALYLSSFNPVKVLKGTFKAGRFALLPRKVLVVLQFTVSVTLIIGTMIIYRQIQFVKNRPIGYDNNGLIFLTKNTPDLNNLNYDILRNELLATGVVENTSQSQNPITTNGNLNIGYSWEGMDPTSNLLFNIITASHDEGKTVGFHFKAGRDFSRDYPSDSSAVIVNETAAKIIGEQTILQKTILNGSMKYHVIGVVNDMVGESPYQLVYPSLYFLGYYGLSNINIKIKPTVSVSSAIAAIEKVFRRFNPGAPFEYKFADQELSKKFTSEELIGKLAAFFAILAVFISCLGLFGLASFVAEQRNKEIGIRKVLGASIANVWKLLTTDFVLLVIISCLIATPIAYLFMSNWLQKYTYRTELSWWIFALASGGSLMITLLTVSFQAIKAAIMNPIKSLRSE